MDNLEGRKLKRDTEAAYPPILDEDPIYAAQFLCKEDLDIYYKVLKKVFSKLKLQGRVPFPILTESIRYSKKNLEWFITFFREMEAIRKELTFPINLPSFTFTGKNLEFQPPFYVDDNNIVHLTPIKIRSSNPIHKHRVEYIRRHLEVTAFRDGYPAWYSFDNTTVFENYDENSNIRVRIDFNDGEFLYYICGASDNWQQLQEVPLEIDYVVSALLFRN